VSPKNQPIHIFIFSAFALKNKGKKKKVGKKYIKINESK